MPTTWIEVLDASGNRYGSGPITTATGWQQTASLDQAGGFSFAMPATDPVLECPDGTPLLKNKRYVRCWTAGDDPLNPRDKPRLIGAGIIEQIGLDVSDSEATMLNVSGVDLLSELGNVTVGDLALFDDDVRLPSAVNIVIPALGSSVVWHPDDSVTLLRDPMTYLYIKSPSPFFRVTLDLSSPLNITIGVLKAQYFNEDAVPMGWENVPITDGTKTPVTPAPEPPTYKPLAKDGVIEFESPSGWGKTKYGIYDLRLYSDEVDLTEVKIHSITITERVPTMTALQDTMALAPAGWTLDPAGKLITEANKLPADRKGIYQQMNKESVLATLGMIAERLGEHFILSPTGRRVLWIGTDKQASGLRALGPANPVGEPDAFTLYVTDLSRTLDSMPLFNRIYVAGGGTGEERITLSDATDPAPAGYTLNTTEGWLQHDASAAEFGRIDNPVEYPDIVALNNSHDAQAYAGNALLQQAYEALRRGCAIQEAYQLSVLPALYPLYPGQTIYVSYHKWTADGFHAINIETTLWVLDVATQVAPSGAVYTVGLTVALIDTYPTFDGSRTAQAINDGRSSRAVTPPNKGLTDLNIGEIKSLSVKNGSVVQVVKTPSFDVVPDGQYPSNPDGDHIRYFVTKGGKIIYIDVVPN